MPGSPLRQAQGKPACGSPSPAAASARPDLPGPPPGFPGQDGRRPGPRRTRAWPGLHASPAGGRARGRRPPRASSGLPSGRRRGSQLLQALEERPARRRRLRLMRLRSIQAPRPRIRMICREPQGAGRQRAVRSVRSHAEAPVAGAGDEDGALRKAASAGKSGCREAGKRRRYPAANFSSASSEPSSPMARTT